MGRVPRDHPSGYRYTAFCTKYRAWAGTLQLSMRQVHIAGAHQDGEHRLSGWVTTGVALALQRLARRYRVTQRAVLEQLVTAADDDVLRTLEPKTPAWDAYFGLVSLPGHAPRWRERAGPPTTRLGPAATHPPLLGNATKTNAQRQAQYRARRPCAGPDHNGERQLSTSVATTVVLALARLAHHYRVTQRGILEQLVTSADDAILQSLDSDSPEWDTYFGSAALLRNARRAPATTIHDTDNQPMEATHPHLA